MDSIVEFWYQMTANPLLFVAVVLIVGLNDAEEECDKLFLTSMRELTQNSTDVLSIISWRKIYECFESCADACEHVSECVGTVIMKNT